MGGKEDPAGLGGGIPNAKPITGQPDSACKTLYSVPEMRLTRSGLWCNIPK